MTPSQFRRQTLEDFVLDDAFRAWVLAPTPDLDAFWSRYRQLHPDQTDLFRQATDVVQHLRIERDELGEPGERRIWQALETRFNELDAESGARRGRWRPLWFRVAAAVAVLLLASLAVWQFSRSDGSQRIRTAFGETRTVTLPDGSTVLLNGNSTLTFATDWEGAIQREVWLEGEGFFKVTKQATPNGSRVKFVTHTPNLDISVLGTQFNVNTRRGNTAVTLLEGKVRLENPRNRQARVLEMKPGDHATLVKGIEKVEVIPAKTDAYAAWTKRLFLFDNTPLRDIATLLNDTYGLEVVFEDQELAERRFTANMPSDNPDTLLNVVAATFDLDVTRTDRQIVFRRKPAND